MSIEKVRAYFEHFGIADRIREFALLSRLRGGRFLLAHVDPGDKIT